MNNRVTLLCLAIFYAIATFAQSNIQAFHRCGQTFVTWTEDASAIQYKVYRHTAPITNQNYQQAQVLATVGKGSGRHITEEWRNNAGLFRIQERFIIHDLGAELAIGTGLLPYTTQPFDAVVAYYAVTRLMSGGVEIWDYQSGVNSIQNAVQETVQEPCPVRVYLSPDGLTEVYTQFVDIRQWNISFDGFAYNYAVMKPQGYDPNKSYPLAFELHYWGGRYNPRAWGGSPYAGAITVLPDDPGRSWWYGFSKTHTYRAQWPDQTPYLPAGAATTGPIVNYTEQRVLRILDELTQTGRYNYDPNRVYCWGNSMGGSGTLTMAMRYPNVFAAAYCSLPATHYQTSAWVTDCSIKWGAPSAQLPIENQGKYAAHLQAYNGQAVYDWQNAQLQLKQRIGDEMAFICTAHGDQDNIIEWWSQGAPWYPIFRDEARRGGSGWTQPNWAHEWLSWRGTSANWGWLTGLNDQFKFRRDESFPAFSRFSGNSYTNHNLNIQWASPANSLFPGAITDTPMEWAVSLKLVTLLDFYSTYNQNYTTATVDVTPRRLQQLQVSAGATYHFTHTRASDGFTLAQGDITPDQYGLLTVPNLQVSYEATRLSIMRANAPPPVCATPASPQVQVIGQTTAQVSWPAGVNAQTYRLQYRKANASQWQTISAVQLSLDLTQLEPCTAYECKLQQVCSNGLESDYSSVTSFVTTCLPTSCDAPMLAAATANGMDGFTFTWAQLPNAQYYHVQFRQQGTLQWETRSVATPSLSASGLLPCTVYEVHVQSQCSADQYSDFNGLTFVTTDCPPQPCLPPNGAVLTVQDSTHALLQWQPNTNALGYIALINQQGTAVWDTISALDTQLIFTSLQPCSQYAFQIASQCGASTSDFTSVQTFQTICPPLVCDAPPSLVVTDSSMTSLSLAWPTIDSAASYIIQYRAISDTAWLSATANDNALIINGLNPCAVYQFQINCQCQNGIISAQTPIATASTQCMSGTKIAPPLADLHIYPNPTRDVLYLTIQNQTSQTERIEVQTVLGQLVLQTEAVIGTEAFALPLPGLAAGVYLLRVGAYRRWFVVR
jgi:pimeloyl-ACP methyl ester carboxylesterase